MTRRLPLLVLPPLLWGCGTDVDGPVAPLLDCVYGNGTTMTASKVHQLRGAESQTLCVGPGSDGGGEFVYIPFFGRGPADGSGAGISLELSIDVAGTLSRAPAAAASSSVAGASVPGESAPAVSGDPAFHDWLRRREIEELTPRIRGGGLAAASPGPGPALVAAAIPEPGDLLDFSVAISCTQSDIRTGRVERVSEHAIMVADTANPAVLSSVDYEVIAAAFDTLVHPMATAHFGEAVDIDGNGRVIFFFTRAVNELTQRESETVTLGFFWSGDLFPEEATPRLEACPAANQAEIMYLIAPDPTGVAGPPTSSDRIRQLIIPLIGHELQHLVNASRRLFVNDAVGFEEPWLNEGLSHIAEELLFYEATDLPKRANLSIDDMTNHPSGMASLYRYMWGNLSNFHRYLSQPDTASLMARDLLSTRGATWSFLRYAADRSGRGDAAFFFDLVNARSAGLANLDQVVGAEAGLGWMQDWTVSLYTDDLVEGVAERFAQPSWNLRSIYAGLDFDDYPLDLVPLRTQGPVRVSLLPGGTAFTTFAVESGEQAVLHVAEENASQRSAVRGSLVRIR